MDTKTAIKQLKLLQKDVKGMRLAAEEWKEEWQILISIIMSARTRDETTIKVAEKLFAVYMTPVALAAANPAGVYALIRPVNFSRNKTKSVIGCAKGLVERFGSTPPHDCDLLISLPGVGRKTANVFLSEVGKDAIGVDTHVSYISQKLGWTKHQNPHK
ncbi:MAG: endonuclease III, partial [bacterium]|nr:endonuclease III [bacterium]